MKPPINKSRFRVKNCGFGKNNARDYSDPAYKEWRKQVYKRDNRTCRYPGCTCKKRLQAHHILPWGEFPALRFNIQNGITLCKKHHDMVKGREKDFIQMFHNILLGKI